MSDQLLCAGVRPPAPAAPRGRLPGPWPDRPAAAPARPQPPTAPLLAGADDTDPDESHIVRGID
ncbi:hypothetical protein ACWD0J_06615 [Streptomyces sp. NPDC003011]